MVILLPLLTHTLEVSRRRVHQQNTVLFAPRRNLADWTVILKSVIIAPKETMGGTFIASPVDEHWPIIKLFVVSICFTSFLVLFNARCIDFVQWEREHPNKNDKKKIWFIDTQNRFYFIVKRLKNAFLMHFQWRGRGRGGHGWRHQRWLSRECQGGSVVKKKIVAKIRFESYIIRI